MHTLHKGFTLIELLATIAIVGILASSVLAAVGNSRAKARDAKRIAGISEIQKSLEIYYDAFQTYPSSTPSGYTGADAALQMIYVLGYLHSDPSQSGNTYQYFGGSENVAPYTECTGVGCRGYALSVSLEREDNPLLAKDADIQVLSGGVIFDGASNDCGATAGSPELCLDVTPLQIQQ